MWIIRLVIKGSKKLKTFGLIARLAGFFCFCSLIPKSKKCLQVHRYWCVLRLSEYAIKSFLLSVSSFLLAVRIIYLSVVRILFTVVRFLFSVESILLSVAIFLIAVRSFLLSVRRFLFAVKRFLNAVARFLFLRYCFKIEFANLFVLWTC